MNLQWALDQLNSLLPLKQRQNRLPLPLKALHQEMLYSLVERGRPLSRQELEKRVGAANIVSSLERLSKDDLIVLDAETGAPRGAYPVSIDKTAHMITVNTHHIHAMCALDAVSVAPMFNTEVRIASHCHLSQSPITINMRADEILAVQPVSDITVGIRWQTPAAVAAHSLCLEMVFLKDRSSADAWQSIDPQHVSLFTLAEAVHFGNSFFSPLLD